MSFHSLWRRFLENHQRFPSISTTPSRFSRMRLRFKLTCKFNSFDTIQTRACLHSLVNPVATSSSSSKQSSSSLPSSASLSLRPSLQWSSTKLQPNEPLSFFTPTSWDWIDQATHPPISPNQLKSTSLHSMLHSCSSLVQVYLALSKARLAALVTLTSMVGYAMAPTSTTLSTLLATTFGTSLCVASANTFNQLMESPFDAQMSRTRHRPLVRHAIGPLHSFLFGSLTGLAGAWTLANFVNPVTTVLGVINLFLYAFVYTPMKRRWIANTWVGAVVGAIPPMMGWTACTGSLLGTESSGAYFLAFLLYAWQFPHFNALSYNLRREYSQAHYAMMAVTDPDLNARVALRYSLALLPLPFLTTYLEMTTPLFLVSSSLFNLTMTYHAYRFWKHRTKPMARDLFFSTLIHLPILLAAFMFHKYTPPNENELTFFQRLHYYLDYYLLGSSSLPITCAS